MNNNIEEIIYRPKFLFTIKAKSADVEFEIDDFLNEEEIKSIYKLNKIKIDEDSYTYDTIEENILDEKWCIEPRYIKNRKNRKNKIINLFNERKLIILLDGYFFYYNHEFEEETLARINNNPEILKGLEIITWDEYLIKNIIK